MIRPVLALAAAVGLSACASVESANQNNLLEPASRAVPVEAPLAASADQAPGEQLARAAAPSFKVVTVNVSVPETLRVSEANRYYPGGDIVWREDPIGNRYEQVKTIVAGALLQGVSGLDGAQEVHLDVVVRRFHALTEKARYTVGGVHAIQFDYRLRDANTGATLGEAKFVRADFEAFGGRTAIAAEAKGVTQKVRITNHLANVIRQELSSPGGYVAQDTGLLGAINQL